MREIRGIRGFSCLTSEAESIEVVCEIVMYSSRKAWCAGSVPSSLISGVASTEYVRLD